MHSPYYNKNQVDRVAKSGQHRDQVGGMWDEIGRLQYDFLLSQGLRPNHRLIDIGCGALRGGVHFIRYLEPGNYYGIDINSSLFLAGYESELGSEELRSRMPKRNFIETGNFDITAFPVHFDFGLAISVFTHLPLDVIRVCLERVSERIATGGSLYASFFEVPAGSPTHQEITHYPGGITTKAGENPYHHLRDDFVYICRNIPFDISYIGDFNHPRNQKMLRFQKIY